MSACTMENWQPIAQLLRALQILPNLQTLSIRGFPSNMIGILRTSCEGMVFPSIVILALPAELSSILDCFPNVHTLTPLSNASWLLQMTVQRCDHIHTVNLINTRIFDRYSTSYYPAVKCVCETIPHLQRLSIEYPGPDWSGAKFVNDLRSLEGMETLCELRIRFVDMDFFVEVVEVGKAVLRTSKASTWKQLRVQHRARYPYHPRPPIESSETCATMNGGQWSITTHSPIPSGYEQDWS
ncbi:hypothetical protein B0H19DRAFT_1062339 [Mycena capillaripes]|nr:hypothetical protein B0H19DRAFT_1062339 [Mycena capillaripes]